MWRFVVGRTPGEIAAIKGCNTLCDLMEEFRTAQLAQEIRTHGMAAAARPEALAAAERAAQERIVLIGTREGWDMASEDLRCDDCGWHPTDPRGMWVVLRPDGSVSSVSADGLTKAEVERLVGPRYVVEPIGSRCRACGERVAIDDGDMPHTPLCPVGMAEEEESLNGDDD